MNKARRPPRRQVDGVLLLDKPAGITSNTALQKARWLFNAAKAGHTGTLDPMATGLLPLCFGEATKFAGELLDADKSYRATLKLGVTTDSADADGAVLMTRPVSVTNALWRAATADFRGEIEQLPPMHSALKRGGIPLYEFARETMTLPERDLRLAPADALLGDLPRVTLEERGTARVLHGQGVRHDGEPGGRFRLYGADGAFLGVGLMSADGWLNPRRLVAADQGQIQENP
ncbi:MAG: tRNA pseudouridine(55) synthase TruB [Rhodocyclaceae bacterium]|nr:tRNA pseudouridine(55) synthase TruB [Rhodocyclaceae bacterium]